MAKIDAHPSLLFQVFVVLWFLMGIAAGDPSDDCNYGGPSIKGHCRHHFLEQNRCHHEKFNTVSEGIPLDLLYQFQLMAQYAAAAYWPGNNNSTDTPLSCSSDQCKYHPEGNCPLVEAANATTSVEFKNTPPWLDDHGFIAVDHTHSVVVLAFKGTFRWTQAPQNWLRDITIWRICSDFYEACSVHENWLTTWIALRDVIMQNVNLATYYYRDYRFAITGHSLGAALATLAVADFRRASSWYLEHTELFTFGSPRIGNVGMADFLTKQSNKSYRITVVNDPIPQTPGPISGYMHMSPEYWISDNPSDPVPEDIHVVTGYYNRGGNTGQDRHESFEEHRRYFGSITRCDPDPPIDPSHQSMSDFISTGQFYISSA